MSMERLREVVEQGFEAGLSRKGWTCQLLTSELSSLVRAFDKGHLLEGDYGHYSLALLKRVALEFGFPDELPGKQGDEWQFSSAAENYYDSLDREEG